MRVWVVPRRLIVIAASGGVWMNAWPSPFLLAREHFPWVVDASHARLGDAAYASLRWEEAFAEQVRVERGDRVNVDDNRQVGHYWLRDPGLAPTLEQAAAIQQNRERAVSLSARVMKGEIRATDGEPFTHVLHIGIGGSQLGPSLIVNALGDTGLKVEFMDNTDPDGIARILTRLGPDLAHTLVLVASKSGSTPEPRNALAITRAAMKQVGVHPPQHLISITMEGTELDKLAKSEGWLAALPTWSWVGGRFSPTSVIGLLPADLAGVDTEALLTGAAQMDTWTRSTDPWSNPAAIMAGAWYLSGRGQGERSLVVLPYADRLQLLARYLQQLVMESLGKRHDRRGREVYQGLTVYGNKGSTDQHAYVQQLRDGRNDFLALFVQVLGDGAGSQQVVDENFTSGDFLQGFLLGTRQALTDADRPSVTVTVDRVDAFTLGGLIALFERSVGLYAALIGINGYHQPAVEAGKAAASSILSISRRIRAYSDKFRTVQQLADELQSPPDEIWYVAEHLVSTGRAQRKGSGPLASYLIGPSPTNT